MTFNPLDKILDIGNSVLDRVIPDPIKRAEEKRKLIELHQKGDQDKLNSHVQLMIKQADINLADAKSGNAFQANWRPMIGWVGAISLALANIPKALVITYIWTKQNLVGISEWDGVDPYVMTAFPDLGVTDIIGLLLSLLGVAAMRSYDKKNNTDTK